MHDASRALASRDSYASVGAGGKQMRKMHVMAGGDQSKGEKQSGYVGFPAQQTGRLQTSGLLSRSSGDQKSEIEVWAGACFPEVGGERAPSPPPAPGGLLAIHGPSAHLHSCPPASPGLFPVCPPLCLNFIVDLGPSCDSTEVA